MSCGRVMIALFFARCHFASSRPPRPILPFFQSRRPATACRGGGRRRGRRGERLRGPWCSARRGQINGDSEAEDDDSVFDGGGGGGQDDDDDSNDEGGGGGCLGAEGGDVAAAAAEGGGEARRSVRAGRFQGPMVEVNVNRFAARPTPRTKRPRPSKRLRGATTSSSCPSTTPSSTSSSATGPASSGTPARFATRPNPASRPRPTRLSARRRATSLSSAGTPGRRGGGSMPIERAWMVCWRAGRCASRSATGL